jgi:flagellar basal body-associated protein FliL
MMLRTILIVAGIAAATVGAIVFYMRSKKNKSSQKIQPQINTTTPDTSKE